MDRRQAAEYLHCCLSTLAKLSIPIVKIRRRVLYRKADLNQWIAHHIVKPEVGK
jgi:hypothetical protein